MNKIYYLDSNICIFALIGRNVEIREKIDSFTNMQIKLPSMVKAELATGALKSANPDKNIKQVEDFCRMFEIVPFDKAAVWVYAEIRANLERKGQIIGQNDLVIAATVLSRNGILITNNIKEFSRIEGLLYEDWTKK